MNERGLSPAVSATTANQDAHGMESAARAVRLDASALAGAAAVVSVAVMLLLGAFGAVGVYGGAVAATEQWHPFFEPTAVGTVGA